VRPRKDCCPKSQWWSTKGSRTLTTPLALHPGAKTTEEIFDDSYSEEQLTCGRNKVVNFVCNLTHASLAGERVFHLLNLYGKLHTWPQLRTLFLGFRLEEVAHVYPSASRRRMPSELVLFRFGASCRASSSLGVLPLTKPGKLHRTRSASYLTPGMPRTSESSGAMKPQMREKRRRLQL